jgi:hypothetical protein
MLVRLIKEIRHISFYINLLEDLSVNLISDNPLIIIALQFIKLNLSC